MSPRALLDRLLHWLLDPVDAHAVGVMRVALGLLLIGGQLFVWPDLAELLGPEAGIPFSAVQDWSGRHRHSLYNLAGSTAQAHALHAAGLVIFVLFTLGWQTRVMSLLSLVVLVSVHQRMPWMQHGGDRLLRLWTLYMCLVPAGAQLSLDARRRGKTRCLPPVTPALAHRLIQLQLCVMYAMTAMAKVGGSQWADGSALYYAIAAPHFQRAPALSEALIHNGAALVVLSGATWLTLAWEASFPVLVWFRRARPAVLWAGVAVHMGIFLLMTVGSFSPASLWGYLAFVHHRRLGDLGRWLAGRLGGAPPLVSAA